MIRSAVAVVGLWRHLYTVHRSKECAIGMDAKGVLCRKILRRRVQGMRKLGFPRV
ncbi:MAG: hypothetical protein ACTJLK_00855 [Anaplasma sp.]